MGSKQTPSANKRVPPALTSFAPVNHGSLLARRAGTLETLFDMRSAGRKSV